MKFKIEKINRQTLVISIIIGIAVILRIVHLISISSDPVFSVRIGDEIPYHKWALEIASGKLLADRAFFTTPMYAYFLGFIYKIFGPGIITVRVIQSILSIASLVFIFFSSRKLFSFPESVIPTALVGFCIPVIFYESFPEKTILVFFLTSLSILLILRALEKDSVKRWALAGFVCGITVLSHAILMTLVGSAILYLLFFKRNDFKKIYLSLLVFCGSCLIAISSATIHNAIASGSFVFIASNGGQNFYTANHSGNKIGLYKPPSFATATLMHEEMDFHNEAEKRTGNSMTPSQVSRYWFKQGLIEIVNDKNLAVRRFFRRLRWVFHSDELTDTRIYNFYKSRSFIMNFSYPDFGIISIFGISGFFLSYRRKQFTIYRFFNTGLTLLLCAFFVYGRYRLPILITLSFFATLSFQLIKEAILEKRFVKLSVMFIIILFSTWFVYGEVAEVPDENFGHEYINLGIAFQKKGDLDKAIYHYTEAIKLKPGNPMLYYNIGAALHGQGDLNKAMFYFSKAIELKPDYAEVYNNMGIINGQQGKLDDADKYFTKAIELKPEFSDAHYNYGFSLYQQGKLQESAKQYKEALRLNPGSAKIQKSLKQVLRKL